MSAAPDVRREWRIFAAVTAGVFLLLTVLSFNGDRAASDGLLAGIGWRYLQGVLLTMLVFGIMGLGLNLQFGFTGLLNFGHVMFLGIGAYTAAILSWRLGDGAWDALGPVAAAGAMLLIILVASAVAILGALVLGAPTLRLREDYLAITTIGAAEIMRTVWLNETQWTKGPQGLSVRMPGSDALRDRDGWWRSSFENLNAFTGIDLDPYFAAVTLIAVAAIAFVYFALSRLTDSPWGRVVKAIRENEDVAAALGKNVFKVKLQSLAIGAVVAAVGGVLFAWTNRFLTPASFLPIVTFYAWIALVLGGSGNHRGAILGSVILWGLFESARNLDFLETLGIATASGPEQVLLIGVLLVFIMLFRPQGALGNKEELRD